MNKKKRSKKSSKWEGKKKSFSVAKNSYKDQDNGIVPPFQQQNRN